MRDPISKCMEDDELLDTLLDQPLEELILKCFYFLLENLHVILLPL